MRTRPFDFTGPAGRLEGILMTPSESPNGAAVLCHAHPLHGGVMHFKVLYRDAKVLQERRYAVLRFNFRGVGRSEGTHDDGRGEQDDVRAALDAAERAFPKTPILVGGFSFGAIMALSVGASDPRASALLALGLPVGVMSSTVFLRASRKPRLFVTGERDEFGNAEAIRGNTS